jgi:hypothetical protein
MGNGIDYGMGTTNVDHSNGIRYGVINQNEVLQAWADSSEGYYGEPACPKCGGDAKDYNEACQDFEEAKAEDETGDDDERELEALNEYSCADYGCDDCGVYFGSDEAYGDEALSFFIDDEEYKASCGEDGDIFIVKSPYYTRAQFCSPCAPGACYLTNPTEEGEKAYCFGHDWFEDNRAPYPVFSVATDERIEPASEEGPG